jgi:hypothetical protein
MPRTDDKRYNRMIKELKTYVIICDSCGKSFEWRDEYEKCPDNWHRDRVDGNIYRITEKHYCHDCFIIKDIIE